MKARSGRSRTADLFSAPRPAPVPAPAPILSTPSGGVPPTPQGRVGPRVKQLWYAVVFPQELVAPTDLQRLALRAQQFTSFVSIEAPNALLLEVKGSLRLFGSLEQLQARIDAVWQALGLAAVSAVAPATLAALWCARAGKRLRIEDPSLLAGRLAPLSLTCTAWDADQLRLLQAVGITRLGELLRLPRAGLARRLGAAAVLDLDIALGKQPAPRRAFVVRERFRERSDLEMEIEHVALLEQAAAPLILRCAQFLRTRQSGVQSFELRLRHRSAPTARIRLGLASVTSEAHRLTDVLAQRLTRLELSAPVRAIELVSGALQPLSAVSCDAFSAVGGGGGRDTVSQLVERLRARLGERAVYGVSAIAEHRPERAWRRVQDMTGAMAEKRPLQSMPRPIWLLDEPLSLSQQEMRELLRGNTVLQQDPERIESGWWDGKGVARDYYSVRPAHGAKLWIFQERHTQCWYLHGLFA